MKKALFFAGLAAASLLLAGCNKEADVKDLDGFPLEIILSDAQTRTVNAGLSTKWAEGDALSVFYAPAGETTYSANKKFTIQDPETNRATGTVDLEAASNDWYLLYAYASQITSPENTSSGYSYIGCKSNESQKQTGYDSKAHLAGCSSAAGFPLYGIKKNVPRGETPVVEMKHVASAVAIKVKNDAGKAIKITRVEFTAPESIVGAFYVNFAQDPVVLTKHTSYTSATAALDVQDAPNLGVGETATFYMGIKPFTAKVGDKLSLKITADAGVVEKEIDLKANAEFKAGFIKTLNIDYKASAPVQTITVSDIASSIASGNAFSGNLEGATVTFVSGKYAFIQDETAGIVLYKDGHGLNAGDKLSGAVSGSGEVYKGLTEIKVFNVETVTSGQPIPAAKEMTLSELNAAYDANVSVLVKLKGVTVSAGFTSRNTTMTDGEVTMTLRDQKSDLTITAGQYDIIGFPSYYNNKQFGVWAQDDIISAGTVNLFGVASKAIEVPATATSAQIQVTGNVAWTVAKGDNVESVSPESGTGEGTITVTFPANTDTENTKTYIVKVSTAATVAGEDEIDVTITQAKAAELPSGTKFVKVTSTDGLTDGSYLIVNETANVAMKDAVDEVNAVVAVEIVNSEIVATNEMKAVAFTFTASNGAFQGANGKYLAHTGDKNTVNPSDTPSGNTVTFDAGNAIIKADQTYFIQYNKTSGQNRFRYYKNAQTDGAVQLYKLSDGSVTPPAPVEPTLTVPENLNLEVGQTVKLNVTTNSDGAKSFSATPTGVVTIDEEGNVTGVAAGSTTITVSVAATSTYTQKSATVPVTVTAAQTGTFYGKVTAITSGKKYLILAGGQPRVFTSSISGGKVASAAVTVNNGKIEASETTNAYAVTITKDGEDVSIVLPNGTFLLYGTGTEVKSSSTASDFWKVIQEEGVKGTFRFVSKATSTRGLIYRGDTQIFGGYAVSNVDGSTTYFDLDLYELGSEPTVIDEVKLSSIAVQDQKTAFNINDTFTLGEGKVIATYSNGSSKDVTSAANVTAPDLTTAGNKTVTVSYTEGEITKETSYEVTVSDPNPPSGDKVIIIDGTQLTSTATDKDTEKTYGGVSVVFSKGAKIQNIQTTGTDPAQNAFEGVTKAILIGKKDAYIYNKAAIPGKIKKFEMYVNKGASAKVTVGLNFSDTAIEAYSATAAHVYAATLENWDTVIDLTGYLSDNAKYFWYQVTNENNSQIVFRIEYE